MKPTWIHERPEWPHLRWDHAAVATPLAGVRFRQGSLLGRLAALKFELRTEANVLMLTSDVINSAAIEGLTLDTDEVRSSIGRRLGLDIGGLPRPSRDVEGIVEVMLDATRKAACPLTQDRLFSWHAALFPTGRTGMQRITVGTWRPSSAGPMQVVSGRIGNERVHFEAPNAARLDHEMATFLAWFNAPLASSPPSTPIDPVLRAAVAHLWFVTIHPFEDGNGRLARAIGDMALAQADGVSERFYSLSSQIDAERKAYYQHLENTQRGDVDITPWLIWFLGCLDRAISDADTTLSAVLFKARVWRHVEATAVAAGPVNARQRRVLKRLLDGFEGYLTTSKYAKLAKCSTDTALRDMQALLARGILVKNAGRGRSTSYRLAER